MIQRWFFYMKLGWCDLVRLWPTTQHHVIIVAGICLPILMLLGLKRGHVESLRQDLITSPTGRQIVFWSAQKGELMDRNSVDRLESELPVEVIIPETQRVARFRSQSGEHEIEAVTIFATRPGDPLLGQVGIEAPAKGSYDIILSRSVAERLEIGRGDTVDVTLTRGRGSDYENATVACRTTGIMETAEHEAAIAYLDLDVLDQFDAYIRGFRVPELGWQSAKHAAPDTYSSYVIFCEKGHPLTEDDKRYLRDRGFRIRDCSASPPSPLDQILVTGSAEKLLIYQIDTERSHRDPAGWLRIAPSELSEVTSTDDVIIPWNTPIVQGSENLKIQYVGMSLPRRNWLREYLRDPQLAFDYEATTFSSRVLRQQPAGMQVELSDGTQVPFEVEALDPASTEENVETPDVEPSEEESATAVAVIPANTLAWIAAERAGLVQYDADIQMFVQKVQPPVYDRARMYANTIDEVPSVVTALSEKKFAVMSETGRISEIHRQDASLQLLVVVVGAGVFLFGIITVFSVLMDSTDRKRGTIGILRVMGMSRMGVFISILLRASAIGALAACLSLACGWGLSLFLSWDVPVGMNWLEWKPIIIVALHPVDLWVVALGAMLCCCLGAIPPAWKASRLDPFDAIVEGRFR